MARAVVGAAFAVTAILCWIVFDIDTTDGSQLPLSAMTLLPAATAFAAVLAVEYRRHSPGYHRHAGKRRRKRGRRGRRRDRMPAPSPPPSLD